MPPLRLIAVGVVGAALLLAIIATGTTGWVVASFGGFKINQGLFKNCADSTCVSTISDVDSSVVICGDHTYGGVKSRYRAAQAFSVLAILIGFACLVVVLFRQLLATQSVPSFAGFVGQIVEKVPPAVDMAAAAFCGLSMLVAFAVYANLYGTYANCGQSYCDVLKANMSGDVSCGLNYSFALAILSCVLFVTTTGLIFMSNRSTEGYSGISQQPGGGASYNGGGGAGDYIADKSAV